MFFFADVNVVQMMISHHGRWEVFPFCMWQDKSWGNGQRSRQWVFRKPPREQKRINQIWMKPNHPGFNIKSSLENLDLEYMAYIPKTNKCSIYFMGMIYPIASHATMAFSKCNDQKPKTEAVAPERDPFLRANPCDLDDWEELALPLAMRRGISIHRNGHGPDLTPGCNRSNERFRLRLTTGWWLNQPILKNMFVKLDPFPQGSGWT